MIVMLHTADQRAQKQLRDFKAIDCATLDWTMNFSVVRLAAEELQRRCTHRQDFTVIFVNCQNRRLIQNDALLGRIDHRIDRTKVDRQIIGKETAEDVHDAYTSRLRIGEITATDMP